MSSEGAGHTGRVYTFRQECLQRFVSIDTEEINNNCRGVWSVLSDAIDVRLSAS